ncbi:MFS transporter [Chitinophaga sp.]|uniref:MFS transporter n=1 Tax=Chitinophaga sp. TaxID=1869181 RepID=UPI0031D5335B
MQEQKRVISLIFPVLLAVFATFLTMGIGFGVLPQLVHGQLGYGDIIVGIVLGTQNIMALCSRSWAGKNTDSKGAKSSVTKGIYWTFLAGVLYVCAGLTTNLPLIALIQLIIARSFHGIGESFLITGALTWGIGLTGVARTGKVMAWVGICIYGGIGLGAPLGELMNNSWGILAAFGGIILCPVIGSLPMFKLPAIAAHAKKKEGAFIEVLSAIWKQGTSLALSAVGYGCTASFVTLFFFSMHWGEASLAYTVFAATFILTRLFFASFPDKYGGRVVGICSLIIEVAGQLILWMAVSRSMALAGVGLSGIGFSLMFPAMGVEAVKKVKPEMRGSAMGAFTAFADVALGVTGPVAGLIASLLGYHTVFLFGAVCSVVALLLIVRHQKKESF